MPKVFPCYSAHDRQIAHQLAGLLERGAGAEVWLEEGEMQPGEDLVGKVEEGLAADVVLVLLSPDSVPNRWILERWKSVFWDQAAQMGTALATLLCRDCKFPDLLRRKNFFDLRPAPLPGFRAVKRWLKALAPPAQKGMFSPAALPSFRGREAELETLGAVLADAPGTAVVEGPPGSGKTVLALEFAARYQQDFDVVLWLTCTSRTLPALAGDLASQLGTRLDRDLESNLHEVRRLCAQHRCLLVLDDAALAGAAQLLPRGQTSVLLTTSEEPSKKGFQAASISLSPCHARDPEQVAETVRKLDGAGQRLLSAICASAPCGSPLDISLRAADTELEEGRDIVAWFVAQDILIPLDDAASRYLVSSAVRERMALRGDGRRWARHHALAVAGLFGSEVAPGLDLTPYWPDLQHAFARALPLDWTAAGTLARRGVMWSKAQDRLAEAFEILQEWTGAARQNGDRRVLDDCAWEQSWILERWGRTREAQELDDFRRRQYADQMPLLFD